MIDIMGIEQFFSTISKKFNIITKIKDNTNDIIETDYIYMDFNSVIHNISTSLEIIDDLIIIENINIFLTNFIKIFDLEKLKLIYIALDGVPTFSKILEQKKRRYVGNILNKILNKKIEWSKNNISPGTNFMDKLSNYLNNLDKKLFKNIKISDSNEKGEGEMKILDLINELNPNDKVIFFSPDSDVILLSMISKNNNIKIIKQEKNNIFSIIDISLLKESIFNYCITRIKNKINFKNLINDIVFIFSIFGNDFVPKCESINTNLDILFLIDIYLINFIDCNYNEYIILESNINSKLLYYYFILLSKHERRLLYRNAFINIYYNYNLMNQINFIIDLYKINKNTKININQNKFGESFYNFYNNIISFIDPLKLDIKHDKYGCLYFYFMDKNKLIDLIISKNDIFSKINNIINIKITNYNEFSTYQKIKINEYKSNFGRHVNNLKEITDPLKREEYLLENKLDKYFKIFNPINDFFKRSIKLKKIDIEYYYNTYFNNDNETTIVNEYFKGLRWVYQYYYMRKEIDSLWFYPYNKTPLFETIIKFYSPHNLIVPIKEKILELTPYEQLIYIIPKSNEDDLKKIFPKNLLKKIQEFYKIYSDFFLDDSIEIREGLFDCSNSNFINKCNYKLLENIINIEDFIKAFRNL
jgi:5'-3' exonuclease